MERYRRVRRYELSSFGIVRAKAGGKVIRPFRLSGKGNGNNQYVYLKRWGEYKAQSVPRRVAYAFVPSPIAKKPFILYIKPLCSHTIHYLYIIKHQSTHFKRIMSLHLVVGFLLRKSCLMALAKTSAFSCSSF